SYRPGSATAPRPRRERRRKTIPGAVSAWSISSSNDGGFSCPGGGPRPHLGSRSQSVLEVVFLLVVAIPFLGLRVGRQMLGQILELREHLVGGRCIHVEVHEPPVVGRFAWCERRGLLVSGDRL